MLVVIAVRGVSAMIDGDGSKSLKDNNLKENEGRKRCEKGKGLVQPSL
jgi:hypothetical protein